MIYDVVLRSRVRPHSALVSCSIASAQSSVGGRIGHSGAVAVQMTDFAWLIVTDWLGERQDAVHAAPTWIIVPLADALALPRLDLPGLVLATECLADPMGGADG